MSEVLEVKDMSASKDQVKPGDAGSSAWDSPSHPYRLHAPVEIGLVKAATSTAHIPPNLPARVGHFGRTRSPVEAITSPRRQTLQAAFTDDDSDRHAADVASTVGCDGPMALTLFAVHTEPYALASGSAQMRTDALPEAGAYGSQSECH